MVEAEHPGVLARHEGQPLGDDEPDEAAGPAFVVSSIGQSIFPTKRASSTAAVAAAADTLTSAAAALWGQQASR